MIQMWMIKEAIKSGIVVVISLLVYIILKSFIKGVLKINKRTKDKKRVTTLSKLLINIIKYIILICAVLAILSIHGVDTKAFVTSLGVIGILAGLALQDMLKDIIAGTSIIIEDKYDVGDYVIVNGFEGEVILVGLKTTRIKAYNQQVLIINNRNIEKVINLTKTNPKAIIDISVSYNSDLEKVERVLNNVCAKLSKELPYLKSKLEILGVEKLDESAIVYRIVGDAKPDYLSPLRLKRAFLREIKIQFDANNIEIPYNQLVVHNE